MARRLTSIKPRVSTVGARVQQQAQQSDSWRAGKTTNERGYTYAWQKARERFLHAHPLCVYCEREGRVTLATVVDHKTPHRGDMVLFWDESNWQSMCAPHHDGAKQAEEGGRVGSFQPSRP